MDPIRPIDRTDRAVQPVELPRLRPLEREPKERRRERKRLQAPPRAPKERTGESDSGLDVRV